MRVLALAVGAHRRHHVIAGVERVVGGGGKIGPVRLDVAQVQAPAPVVRGLLDELDGPVGGERGLRMRFRHPRRPAGVSHAPAAHAPPVLPGGAVRVQLPGIVTGVALAAQVVVVSQAGREDGIGVEPLQLLERLEAAVDDRPADAGVRVHPEAGQRGTGAGHLHLADQHRRETEIPHVVSQGQLPRLERVLVGHRAVRGHVAAGVDAGPGRTAQRRLAVGAGEPHPAGGEPVDVRGLQVRVAVAGQVVPPELVAHDEQDVGVVLQRRLQGGELLRRPDPKAGARFEGLGSRWPGGADCGCGSWLLHGFPVNPRPANPPSSVRPRARGRRCA